MPSSKEINGLINVIESANSESEEEKIQAALWLHDYIEKAAQRAANRAHAEMAQGAF